MDVLRVNTMCCVYDVKTLNFDVVLDMNKQNLG